ncbi:hypothetical protein JIR001_11260 [Polycladomyces abyssicola]|uniref:TIGR04086 family membrane protein n=1 Tax=Polycladomyces abyssicola TaxID=1125966 RepID=A0A8D5UEQ5_9BACL|nr:TIGR04086 family membrane protein [Polycladomyces abyssicola]BCU81343.1 hypothetical protein JIR001_11260 [Polycladomyces abyssicola]
MKTPMVDHSSKFRLRSPLLAGLLLIWTVVIAGSVLVTFLLRWTSIQESSLPFITYGINGIALLGGGWLAGRKSRGKGWLYGGMAGLLYALIVWMLAFLAFDTAMRLPPLLFSGAAFGLSALGGMVGVNSRR